MNTFDEKTRTVKSRATVPLKDHSQFMRPALASKALECIFLATKESSWYKIEPLSSKVNLYDPKVSLHGSEVCLSMVYRVPSRLQGEPRWLKMQPRSLILESPNITVQYSNFLSHVLDQCPQMQRQSLRKRTLSQKFRQNSSYINTVWDAAGATWCIVWLMVKFSA